jgi:ribose transport system substrate-binding protein
MVDMKRMMAMLMLGVMLLVTACVGAKPTETKPPAAPEAKKKVVGVSLPEQDNPFYVAVKNWLETEAKVQGITLKITIANRDSAKQLADIEDFIQSKVDAIIMTPVDVVGSVAAVNSAKKANIPVVTVARYVQNSDAPIARIATDDVAVGRMVGEFIVARLGDKGGNVVLLRGPAGASYANLQEQGLLEVLDKNKNIKIVAKQAHPDVRVDALKVMEDILQAQPKIDAVYGSNDEVALGAIAALKAAKRTNVIVTGGNGIPAAMDAIKAGDLTFTAAKEPGKQAVLAVQAVAALLKGEKVTQDQFTAAVGVTKENVETVDLKYTK